MVLSDDKLREIMKRLLIARLRILNSHGFYGLLLMHMKFSIDDGCETAYTDAERIAFSPRFLEELSDSELDFVLMHEILHVVLQHCIRSDPDDPERYNIAADIVVNSIIMDENAGDARSITLSRYGESIHKAPDGKEGSGYTAEEVFEMLKPRSGRGEGGGKNGSKKGGMGKSRKDKGDGDRGNPGKDGSGKNGKIKGDQDSVWDDHSHWGKADGDGSLRDVWVKRFAEACEAVSIRDPSNACGTLPTFAKRILDELMNPQTDWRRILCDFIQEEINDYSFSPPDRRFEDSPFFLPDFNEKDETVKDILFMIDTSGSMSDKMITAAYSEIKGAIDQFNGKLCGRLGFFDAAIIEPQPFSNFEEFSVIRPAGGGGTNFQIIFEYVNQYMIEEPPASIIILTDGYASFPKEKLSKGIPVLWLLNNEDVKPPWGKVARIKV